jgi:hypothetical protein
LLEGLGETPVQDGIEAAAAAARRRRSWMDTCEGRDGRPRSRRSRPSPSASASVAAAASFPSSPCPRSSSPVYVPLFVKELDTTATGRMSPVPAVGWRRAVDGGESGGGGEGIGRSREVRAGGWKQ